MNRVSYSVVYVFTPQEGEVFFAEVPGKGIDRKVKALLSKDGMCCENCIFFRGELQTLCLQVKCLIGDKQLTFRKVNV